MNAGQLREAIKIAADAAFKEEPTDVSARARSFIAGLTGWIERDEPELAAVIWSVLKRTSVETQQPTAATDA